MGLSMGAGKKKTCALDGVLPVVRMSLFLYVWVYHRGLRPDGLLDRSVFNIGVRSTRKVVYSR